MKKRRLLLIFLIIVFGSGLILIDQFGQVGNDNHLWLFFGCALGLVISVAGLLISLVFGRLRQS